MIRATVDKLIREDLSKNSPLRKRAKQITGKKGTSVESTTLKQ